MARLTRVHLRQRDVTRGRISLYLDYYPAYKEKFFRENLNDFLDSIETTDVKKEYLTLDEVKLLAKTPCYDYPILKTASLFSCMTGLRISDILKLD